MSILLGPDILVNASVAPGTPPDRVVKRVLGEGLEGRKTTAWVLRQVNAMLQAIPEFKDDAIKPQLEAIRNLVELVPDDGGYAPESWSGALVAAAKAVGADRVITDHPDLLETDTIDGVEFVSSEAWLVEFSMPPPPPPSGAQSTSP